MPCSILSDITVERIDEYSVNILLKSHGNVEIFIFKGNSPHTIDTTQPILQVKGKNRIPVTKLDPHFRPYFLVVPEGTEGTVVSERKVTCQGTFNFRDLGGYITKDNKTIKWGELFRSDGLAGLTDKGSIQFNNLGIKKIYDFRTIQEVQKSPDKLPEDDSVHYFNYPVKHGEFNFVSVMKKLKQGDASWLTKDYMTKGYIKGIEEFSTAWGQAFKSIVQNEGTPSIFHCTGGKDRTGTFSALLLLVLGVHENTIIYDHQLSNKFIKKMLPLLEKTIHSYGIEPKLLEPYFTAPLSGITTLLDHIRQKYDTAENYLVEKCGVLPGDFDLLKEKLLV